ncbi:MAG TPA: family 1 glycosylhydrolase [Spirochaetota bacterium]|nr:family 1 glycosylhydrolase [Spirochaetota bacterium]
MKKFPDKFYFGASTSSHQVEGGCLNDWSEWEKLNAERLAKESVKFSNLASWDRIKHEARSPENYISGIAADHYTRYAEDFDIAEKIGINAYRFSIEWSRIEPMRGVWDADQLNHYSKIIAALRERNIEPFVTVWHWTLPLWLSETGGVLNREFPELFAKFASKLAEEFSGHVKFFITVNEPEIYSLNSYLRGIWPPQKKGFFGYITVMESLVKSHILAYDEIKKRIPESVIGPACNMTYFESGKGYINKFLTSMSERYWNRYFINRVKSKTDYIGVNYYFHNRINYGFNKNENRSVSDLGWELYPHGLENILNSLAGYKLPVYITENGLADACDEKRAWFIEVSLRSVMRAMENRIDVRGYFHWSLMDNFEWDKGFWPRFGLISIDRKDLSRRIRIESCDRYREIIEKGI